MFLFDRYNMMTLQTLLGGHQELSETIIRYKNKVELEDHKQDTIGRDFYYWLSYDLPLRSKLGEIIKNYRKIDDFNKRVYIYDKIDRKKHRTFPLNEYFRYYDEHRDKLGLNSLYERGVSLQQCYKTQWWKTTEKNSLLWKKIHRIIRFANEVKIYKRIFRYFTRYRDLVNECRDYPENFRVPTLRERYKITCECCRWWYPSDMTLIFADLELAIV